MFITFIKYLSIIICSFYTYLHLLNIKQNKAPRSFILFLLLLLPEIYFLRKYAASFSIIIMVVLFAFYVRNALKTPLNLSLIVSALSIGIAHLTFTIAAFLLSLGVYLISPLIGEYTPNLIGIISIGIIQFFLTVLPFRLKRLKNGMPFLYKCDSGDIGVYISIILLLAASFLGMKKDDDLVIIIPIFFSIICGFALLFWWRSNITRNYVKKAKSRELEELQETIDEYHNQMEQLKHHNKELSRIIHKDNKLIPAMEYAVRDYLISMQQEPSKEKQIIKAKELLAQLNDMSQERTGIINNYEADNKILPSTDVSSLDILLSYMYQKAKQHQIGLDLTVSGDVRYIIEKLMKEADLKTLLADLIENAIIATKAATKKNILINLGISGYYYTIDIFDSGAPFITETLLNAGIKQTTTHKNDGGSGIGLMTAFDLLRKYEASFVIDDCFYHNTFTKKVSVCFDHLNQYRINTKRNDIQLLSKRNDIILMNRDTMNETAIFIS